MAARILIIEDNAANLELMSYLLRAFGHTVLSARDGESGLAVAASERPDLILCDIQLPGIGGMEVASRLRRDVTFAQIPVVAVTAFAMVGDRESIMAAGFHGYFTKPIEPETFVAQVEAFLRPKQRTGAASIGSRTSSPQPAPQSRGRTVLVVDDRPVNLELASSVLGGSGYKVTTAPSMREALRLAHESAPDLIMSDVGMANGSGYEFIRVVKADPRLRSIPFVFITSTMTTESERRKGLALGAARYLFRPIEPHDLLREIEACLHAGKD